MGAGIDVMQNKIVHAHVHKNSGPVGVLRTADDKLRADIFADDTLKYPGI